MFHRIFGTALVLTLGLLSVTVQAATIGHWSFEGTGGDWLLDASGNGHDLTTRGSPSQYDLPATGVGSAFPNPVPLTGQPNLAAAQLSGADQWLTAPDDDAFTTDTFTIETFLNIDPLPGSSESTPIVAGHFNSNDDQRGWFFAINRNDGPNAGKLQLAISDNGETGAGNTEVIRSPSLAVEPGNDYYAAIAVDATDTSADGITFYLQNLTDGGPLLSEGATHSQVTSLHNSTAYFAIGAQGRSSDSGNYFPGVVDEVRYSNAVLGPSQLLAVPEPGTCLLLATAALALLFRRRRR
ncbi:MAG: LamG-like jellyroll fold domain-containing protein [Thermoguttaceae bacterium]